MTLNTYQGVQSFIKYEGDLQSFIEKKIDIDRQVKGQRRRRRTYVEADR